MAVVAMLEPLNVESMVPPPTARRLNRPGRRPSHLSRASRRRNPRPECKRISPMSTNRGTGSKEKVLTESNMLKMSCSTPVAPPQST